MSEWFEDEQFWIDTFPFMFPRERLEATPEEVDRTEFLLEKARKAALEKSLERTGFSGVRLYGDLDGSEYGPDAKRLVELSRKPQR
jgi:hypothetical protein